MKERRVSRCLYLEPSSGAYEFLYGHIFPDSLDIVSKYTAYELLGLIRSCFGSPGLVPLKTQVARLCLCSVCVRLSISLSFPNTT